jgi:dipeptidase E
MSRQIIAMGGLKEGAQREFIYKYILEAKNKKKPKICFVPTAGGDTPESFYLLYSIFSKFDCEMSHLSLVFPETADPESLILAQDIVLVPGGNTKNMLALWREWGLDVILRKAYDNGILLAGWSAGALCWFQEGVTDSIPGELNAMKCLGFLEGSCCPHYDGDPKRPTVYHKLLEEKKLRPGVAIEDATALHYVDEKLTKSVSFAPGSKAYAVGNERGHVLETELITHYLGEI